MTDFSKLQIRDFVSGFSTKIAKILFQKAKVTTDFWHFHAIFSKYAIKLVYLFITWTNMNITYQYQSCPIMLGP